jgi:hypothetical protein
MGEMQKNMNETRKSEPHFNVEQLNIPKSATVKFGRRITRRNNAKLISYQSTSAQNINHTVIPKLSTIRRIPIVDDPSSLQATINYHSGPQSINTFMVTVNDFFDYERILGNRKYNHFRNKFQNKLK